MCDFLRTQLISWFIGGIYVKGVHSEIVHLHILYSIEMHVYIAEIHTRYILAVVQNCSSFFIELAKKYTLHEYEDI